MMKSKTKKTVHKWPSTENFLASKNLKINVPLQVKRLKKEGSYKEATKYGIMTSKEFWKKLKPFLTNKG